VREVKENSPQTAASTSTSDPSLDVIRAAAHGRVFLWHATAFAALTWISAMPLVFFVSGALTAASMMHRPVRDVLVDRMRRLLIPFWVYGIAVWSVLFGVHLVNAAPGSVFAWRDLIWWVLPLKNPQGNSWENGWLSEPLWFLRVLFVMLLISPLLFSVLRRFKQKAAVGLVAGLAAAVVAGDVMLGVRWWETQNLVTFGAFFVAGVASVAAGLTISRRGWMFTAAGAAAAGAAWVATQWPISPVVNDSHALLMFVGTFWLAVTHLFKQQIGAVMQRRRAQPAVTWLSKRALSVYLWHGACIAAADVLWGRAGADGVTRTALVVVSSAVLTYGVVSIVSLVEDFAARRTLAKIEWRVVAYGFAVVGTGLISWQLLPANSSTLALPPPSEAPTGSAFEGINPPKIVLPTSPAGTANRPSTATDTSTGPAPTINPYPAFVQMAEEADAELAAELQDVLDFVYAQGVPGVAITVVRPDDFRWAGSAGRTLDGGDVTVDEMVGFQSVTKSFTGALILRAWQDGMIDLDEPIGVLDVAPWYTEAADVTPRQLLEHRSGLRNYTALPEYRDDRTQFDSWEAVLRITQRTGVTAAPGTLTEYSSTNFVILGLYAAQVYGAPIEDLLSDELIEPLGLDLAVVGPEPSEPNTGTGGVVGTSTELARWAGALWRDQHVITGAAHDMLWSRIDSNAVGPSSVGFCPCDTDDGEPVGFSGVGASGGLIEARYYADVDVVIVFYFSDSLWTEGRQELLWEASSRIKEAAASR
jgi:CubicO group peptidase (beta-lactamase class C family)/peptidoglycan/LPS O-acetylase OafA/YrhL